MAARSVPLRFGGGSAWSRPAAGRGLRSGRRSLLGPGPGTRPHLAPQPPELGPQCLELAAVDLGVGELRSQARQLATELLLPLLQGIEAPAGRHAHGTHGLVHQMATVLLER